jgi:hypothetical protein
VIVPTMEGIYNALKPVLDTIKGAFEFAWNAIQLLIQTVLGVISSMIQAATIVWNAVIVPALHIIADVVNTVWGTIQGIFTTAFNIIKGVVQTGMGLIHDYIVPPIQTVLSIVTTVLNGLKSIFTSVFGALAGIVQTAVNSVLNIFKPVTDAVGKVGDALGAVGRGDISGAVSDIGHIFGLAEGGVVSPQPGGTVVRLAEAGEKEWVIPEHKMRQFVTGGAMSGGATSANAGTIKNSGDVNINQLIIQGGTGQQMGKQFTDHLKQQGIRIQTG